VIVLPSADRLAPAERDRIRMLVDRALDEVMVTGPRPTVLEPATADAIHDVVESAVRRADTVCVLGRDAQAAITAALALYPSRTGCPLGADVDLESVGRALGAAARAVAGAGTVVVLDGGDGMLDRRWAAGVLTGAATGGATGGATGVSTVAQHAVSTAAELLQLLDAQADAIAAGIVPGSDSATGGSDRRDDGGSVEFPERDDVPVALMLPPVQVVVLDASAEAALLADELLGRGLRLIAPRSLLVDVPDAAGVVLRWRVRWDVVLASVLRQILAGEQPTGGAAIPIADVLVLDAGPAAPRG